MYNNLYAKNISPVKIVFVDSERSITPTMSENKNGNNKSIEENARDAALNCSKSPIIASRRLDHVKSKLNQEKQRSGVVAKRKITEHKEPLYFLVVKETIKEYEKKMNLADDDSDDDGGVGHSDRNNKTEEQKAEFLHILQQKLNEKMPGKDKENHQDSESMRI